MIFKSVKTLNLSTVLKGLDARTYRQSAYPYRLHPERYSLEDHRAETCGLDIERYTRDTAGLQGSTTDRTNCLVNWVRVRDTVVQEVSVMTHESVSTSADHTLLIPSQGQFT